MSQLLLSIAMKLLQGYLANVATKEVFDWALFKILDAGVKSTKTPYDDEWLKAIDAAVHGQPLPPRNE